MKTIMLAAVFALGVGLAGATGAYAAENNATVVKVAANTTTETLSARRVCRLVTTCHRYWWPHCRTVKVCRWVHW